MLSLPSHGIAEELKAPVVPCLRETLRDSACALLWVLFRRLGLGGLGVVLLRNFRVSFALGGKQEGGRA